MKKVYIAPQLKVFEVDIKNSVMNGSPRVTVYDEDADPDQEACASSYRSSLWDAN